MGIIKVSNIWAESLLDWFYKSITDDGGDGDGAIVCKNYKDVAAYFYDSHIKDLGYSRIEEQNSINFTDMSNENFIFTDDPNIEMYGYVFIVEKNCRFGWSQNNKELCIEGVE